jgi:hypothetical protein
MSQRLRERTIKTEFNAVRTQKDGAGLTADVQLYRELHRKLHTLNRMVTPPSAVLSA